MSQGSESLWRVIDGEWHYLGRPSPERFEIGLLTLGSRTLAAIFGSAEAAAPFLSQLPDGVGLQSIDAQDDRAKEEWLRAASQQGAEALLVDPRPEELTATSLPIDRVLWYVLSRKRATACL